MHEILRIKSKREAFDQSKQGLFRHAIRTTQHGYAMIFFRGKTQRIGKVQIQSDDTALLCFASDGYFLICCRTQFLSGDRAHVVP